VDPDESNLSEVRVAFDDLVRDPRQRALDRLGIEDSLGFRGLRAQGALAVLTTVYSFPASRDRVKGVFCVRRGTVTAEPDVTKRALLSGHTDPTRHGA
jgi:hypothetical protein